MKLRSMVYNVKHLVDKKDYLRVDIGATLWIPGTSVILNIKVSIIFFYMLRYLVCKHAQRTKNASEYSINCCAAFFGQNFVYVVFEWPFFSFKAIHAMKC